MPSPPARRNPLSPPARRNPPVTGDTPSDGMSGHGPSAAGAPALTLVTGEGWAPAEEDAAPPGPALVPDTAAVPDIMPLAPADAETARLTGLSRAGGRAR